MKKIKAGIIGGAGYTGGELIRLLTHHPHTIVSFIHSRSQADKQVHSIHADLVGETELSFTSQTGWLQEESVDVIFLCVGHGEAKKFMAEQPVHETIKIIDLS